MPVITVVGPPMPLSEEDKEAIRVMWREHAHRHKSVAWLQALACGKTEQAYFDLLPMALLRLHQHCGAWKALTAQGLSTKDIGCLHSARELVEWRLRMWQGFSFDKKKLKAALLDQYNTHSIEHFSGPRPWQPFGFHRFQVCGRCLLACVGISVSTVRRCTRTNSTSSNPSSRAPTASRQKLISQEMVNFAVATGQSLPTAEGKEHTIDRTINSASHREAREQLQTFMQDNGRNERVSEPMWRRCLAALKENGIVLRCTKSKSLAKCKTCDAYNCLIEAAQHSRNPDDIAEAKTAKAEHLREANEQRAYFEEWKRQALAFPWITWVLTLDGMDTGKTDLPHLYQLIKSIESFADVRVVGCIMFGAPLLVQATTTLDDVTSKGAAASITQFECFINNNWLALDLSNVRPVSSVDSKDSLTEQQAADLSVTFQQAAPKFQPADETYSDGVPLPHAAAFDSSTRARPAAAAAAAPRFPWAKRVPFYWPQHLHVTFDNTGADLKNTRTFNFFGILVALCVFHYITVSTLMVGHTHDIVDQVFSIWANQLRVTDALTLSLMHKLFRERYASRIYELQGAIKRQSDGDGAAAAVPGKSTRSVHAMLHELAGDIGVEPVLLRQTFCIEPMPLLDRPFSNFKDLHVFLISRELDEDKSVTPPVMREAVLLKARHVAKPQAGGLEMYNYQGPGGPYTSVHRLFWVDEVYAMRSDDVFRAPSLRFPTDGARSALSEERWQLKMKRGGAWTANCSDEWTALLDQFDKQYEQDMRLCPSIEADGITTCRRLRQERSAIGKLHRPTGDAGEEDKAHYREKNNRKDKLNKAIREHILAVEHPHLILPNWLRKWAERAELFIRPYYRARGLPVEVAVPASSMQRLPSNLQGRQPHPLRMPHDLERGAVFKRNVFAEAQLANGGRQPKLGDVVITRGRPWLPVYVGIIKPASEFVNTRGNKSGAAASGRQKRKQSMAPATTASKSQKSRPAAAASDGRQRRQPQVDYRGQDEECPSDVERDGDPEYRESDDEQEAVDCDLEVDGLPLAQMVRGGAAAAAVDRAAALREKRTVNTLTGGLKGQVCVRWYAFVGAKFDDENAVRRTLADNPDSARDLQLWDDACAAAKAGEFKRLPLHAVTRWKSIKWQLTKTKGVTMIGVLSISEASSRSTRLHERSRTEAP